MDESLAARVIASGSSWPGAPAFPQTWSFAEEGPYRERFRALHAGRLPAPGAPEVDFARALVVWVSLWRRPTGGYSVELPGAARRGSELVVELESHGPSPGAMLAQVVTSPFALVAVPRPEGVRAVVVVLDGAATRAPLSAGER